MQFVGRALPGSALGELTALPEPLTGLKGEIMMLLAGLVSDRGGRKGKGYK